MFKHQRSTPLLRIRPALLALLVCALACRAPIHAFGQSLRSPTSGPRLEGEFLRFWEQNDGARRLGVPLSAAIWLDGRMAQLFARARLERRTGEEAGLDSVALPDGWQQRSP